MTACEIIWHRILMIGHIGNPIVRVHVLYAQKVQTINAEPNVAEYRFSFTFLIVEQSVTHTDISSFVCRSSERISLQFLVRRREWQAVSIDEFQRHEPAVGVREVVCEEEVDGVALISRQWNLLPVETNQFQAQTRRRASNQVLRHDPMPCCLRNTLPSRC